VIASGTQQEGYRVTFLVDHPLQILRPSCDPDIGLIPCGGKPPLQRSGRERGSSIALHVSPACDRSREGFSWLRGANGGLFWMSVPLDKRIAKIKARAYEADHLPSTNQCGVRQ
jgi:hypothetical protein